LSQLLPPSPLPTKPPFRKGKRLGLGAVAFSGAGQLALGIAGGLALVGRSRVRTAGPPLPEQTIERVKDEIAETKDKAKEARNE